MPKEKKVDLNLFGIRLNDPNVRKEIMQLEKEKRQGLGAGGSLATSSKEEPTAPEALVAIMMLCLRIPVPQVLDKVFCQGDLLGLAQFLYTTYGLDIAVPDPLGKHIDKFVSKVHELSPMKSILGPPTLKLKLTHPYG